MINQEICRERFYALLRYGRKYSGSWDDGDCKHGDNYCFLPTDDDIDDLCDAYEQYTALSERHQRLVEAAKEFLRVICSNTIQNNESLKAINALKAALEGEKGAQETSCQATHE